MTSNGIEQSHMPSLEPSLLPVAQPWRLIGSMAASLVVGVVIGASGMFYRMQTHETSIVKPNPSTPMDRSGSLESSQFAADATSSQGAYEAATTWTPSRSDLQNYLSEDFGDESGQPLWSGKYLLIGKGKSISGRAQMITPNPNGLAWVDASGSSGTNSSSINETPPSTSAQLMRDLMNSREIH
jgi:hypothetical protein